jgi:uncharacterized low-complexity protein
MKVTNKTLALAIGSAFVASIATTSIHAAENPFALKSLSSGYMVADADATADKAKDGKCGTGKCSAAKKKAMHDKEMADKAKEGNCSADKAKEGSCHADKVKEGNCSADKAADKAKEGSCHADKK